jgi:CHAT domain-containing protein
MVFEIPYIAPAIGHSVIYEEYKGNFIEARRTAQRQLDNAKQQKDPTALADALLALGIAHLLQGECSAAIAYFHEMGENVPSDAERRLRALNYSHLATLWQYNLFPDGGGAGAAELELRWNGEEYMRAESLRRQPVFAETKQTPSRFEGLLVHDFLAGLQPSRAFLQTNRYSSRGVMSDELLKVALQGPTSFRQTVETYNAPAPLLASADLAAADLCWRGVNVRLGEEFSARALEAFKRMEDPAGLAACQMMRGDWLSAPFSTPRVWNFAIQESSTGGSELAWTLEEEEFSREGSDPNQARTLYAEAEGFFRQAGAPRGLAAIQLRWGYLAMLAEDYPAAIDHARKARDAFEQCGDRLGFFLAEVHHMLSRIAAGQCPEEHSAAEATGKWGASEGSFSYTLGLGLLVGRYGRHWLVREGDYERALACFRLSSTLFRALGAAINLAGSLIDQALVYRTLGERATAIAFYEQAMDTYEADLNSRPATRAKLGRHLVMLANGLYQLYQEEMNPEGMERSAGRMQAIAGRLPGQGSVSESMANAVRQALWGTPRARTDKDLFSGIELFALANLARTVTEQAGVLVPLYRARQAQHEGDETRARRLFKEAMKCARATSDEERDFLEAVVSAHQKAYLEAAQAFRRYLTKSGFTDQLVSAMGQSSSAQGEAEARRQQERRFANAFSFMVRARAYQEANSYLSQLVGLAGEDWPLRDAHPWEALGDWAEMYEGLGESEKALSYYDRAMREFEARRARLSRDELKTALAGSKGAQYLGLQAAWTALKLRAAARNSDNQDQAGIFASRAFEYSERGRARALLDLMAGSAVLAAASQGGSQTLGTWRQLSAQLTTWRGLLAHERSQGRPASDGGRVASLTQKIESLEADLHRVESELAASNPDFHRAINSEAPVMGLDEVVSALPKGTAILQYLFLGEDLLVWAITHEGMVQDHHIPIDVPSLKRKIQSFHRACERIGPLGDLGEQLAKILLEPLAETLESHSHLIVTPYGTAHLLPFHALPWEGQPLAGSHMLSYLPNASTLQFLHSDGMEELPDGILAVGDPVHTSYQPPLGGPRVRCQPLPAAAAEATFVASLFPQGKPLLADEATKQKVQELIGRYPLLHFATHGYLSEDAPLLSAILLANGEALTVYELMGLNLKARLVVLSACRTGQGTATGGDDVLGLTRGLLGTGVRAAVVSLWPVNDLSTSLLMGEFYRRLRAGDSPAAALQKGQNYLRRLSPGQIQEGADKLRSANANRDARRQGAVKMSEDYHHPHYWAPFMVVG